MKKVFGQQIYADQFIAFFNYFYLITSFLKIQVFNLNDSFVHVTEDLLYHDNKDK